MKISQRKGSVLTKTEIKSLIKEGFEEKSLQPASYDLRIGAEHVFPIEEESDNQGEVRTAESIRIPPFTSIIISSYEVLSLPDNVVGRFDLKIKWALKGLILQVGTQIEPGYKGKLFGLLHNFSSRQIIIDTTHRKNGRLLTCEFSYTTEKAPPNKDKANNNINSLRDFLSNYENQYSEGSIKKYVDQFQVQKEKVETLMSEVKADIKTFNNLKEQMQSEYESTSERINKQTDNIKGELNNKLVEHKNEINNRLEVFNNKNDEKANVRRNQLLIIMTVIFSAFIAFATLYVSTIFNKLYLDADDLPLIEIIGRNKDVRSEIEYLKNEINSLELQGDSLTKVIMTNKFINQHKIDSLVIEMSRLKNDSL